MESQNDLQINSAFMIQKVAAGKQLSTPEIGTAVLVLIICAF